MKHILAYRIFTLAFVVSIFTYTVRILPEISMGFQHQGFPKALIFILPIFATLLIPLYLIWRNISSLKNKTPFLPDKLIQSKNWIFNSAITLIWLSVFIISIFLLSYLFFGITGNYSSLLRSSAAYIFQEPLKNIGMPVIFAMEMLSIYYSKPSV